MQPAGSPPRLYHRLRLRFAPLRRWKSLGGDSLVRAFSMHNGRGGGAHFTRFRCTAAAVWGALGRRNMQLRKRLKLEKPKALRFKTLILLLQPSVNPFEKGYLMELIME